MSREPTRPPQSDVVRRAASASYETGYKCAIRRKNKIGGFAGTSEDHNKPEAGSSPAIGWCLRIDLLEGRAAGANSCVASLPIRSRQRTSTLRRRLSITSSWGLPNYSRF